MDAAILEEAEQSTMKENFSEFQTAHYAFMRTVPWTADLQTRKQLALLEHFAKLGNASGLHKVLREQDSSQIEVTSELGKVCQSGRAVREAGGEAILCMQKFAPGAPVEPWSAWCKAFFSFDSRLCKCITCFKYCRGLSFVKGFCRCAPVLRGGAHDGCAKVVARAR